ncbi:zinc finger, CCHC-type containing protein [Tanacetum coccineum]
MQRIRTPKDFGPKFQLYLIEGTRDEVSDQHSYCFNVEDDPKTFDEAMKSQDVAFWKEAINDEMDYHLWATTLSMLVDPTSSLQKKKKKIKKRRKNENKVKWKWLKGNEGVSNKIEERGLVVANGSQKKLKKPSSVDLTRIYIHTRFSMKDMGEADVILGIRIKHESNGIAISQSHYIEKILKKFNYFDCTPVSTPMDTSEKLMPNDGHDVSQLNYSRVIGCLMYAVTYTRPDIAFAMEKLSTYTSNHGTPHWQAIQRVLKYLKKTMDYRLMYTSYPLMLEGYTNAS